jgi:hypothetical protein
MAERAFHRPFPPLNKRARIETNMSLRLPTKETHMRTRNHLLLAAALVLLCAFPLLAHHAVTAEFDPGKTITVKGVVSKVDWINPHIFVYLDVKDDGGKTTTWMLQSLPPLFFKGSGMTKDVLLSNKQEATISAYPAKDGTQAYGFLLKVSYADGHFFSTAPQGGDPNAKGAGR